MFYVTVFIVVFVILDIIYVSYSFAKKKYAFVWPLNALRFLLSLFISILFLPFFNYFASILNCVYDDDGDYVQIYFPNTLCWSGIYILHAVCSIFLIIIFAFICFSVSITYFERRSTSNDSTSR